MYRIFVPSPGYQCTVFLFHRLGTSVPYFCPSPGYQCTVFLSIASVFLFHRRVPSLPYFCSSARVPSVPYFCFIVRVPVYRIFVSSAGTQCTVFLFHRKGTQCTVFLYRRLTSICVFHDVLRLRIDLVVESQSTDCVIDILQRFYLCLIMDFSINGLCTENRRLSQRAATPHKINVN